MKERYGVVNAVLREKYEKEFQVPFGYDHICYSAEEAIAECKKMNEEENFLNGNPFIVERIFDNAYACNNREQIYSYREDDYEQNN